jgi:hypothetical protein
MWDYYITFISSQGSSLMLASLINFKDLDFDNTTHITSSSLTIATLILIIATFLAFFLGLKRSLPSLSSLHQDLSPSGTYWQLYILFRQFVTLFILVIFPSHLLFQLLTLLLTSVLSLCLLLHTRPYSCPTHTRVNLANELAVATYLYLMLTLA